MARKRTVDDTPSSDDRALTSDNTADSSSVVATPPVNKRARLSLVNSIPSDSPTNLFSLSNEVALEASKRPRPLKPTLRLPAATTDFLELRFQLVRFKVFRVVHAPSNYDFVTLNRLCYFLFGWDGSHSHTFDVVKDVVLFSGNYKEGEIKESLKVLEVRSKKPSHRKNEEYPSYEENMLMLSNIWGVDGHKSSRAVIYNWDLSSPWTVHITVKKGVQRTRSNCPFVLRGKGAPPREDPPLLPWTDELEDEDANSKTFTKEQFNGDAFDRYLRGELVVDVGVEDIVICTKEERQNRWEEERQRIKSTAREIMSDYESSDEGDASPGPLSFDDPGDPAEDV